MSYVTLTEFRARYDNTVPEADEARVQAFLDDACAIAEDVVGTTYEDGDDVPNGIIAVICAAVRRAYENPLGLQGETIGDYTWRGGASTEGVYFTPGEERIMRRAVGNSGTGSIELEGMLPATEVNEDQYLDDAGSSEPILYFAEDDLP